MGQNSPLGDNVTPGVKVKNGPLGSMFMITNFGNFRQVSAKQMGVFLSNQCYNPNDYTYVSLVLTKYVGLNIG
jgi:hypothetical protein